MVRPPMHPVIPGVAIPPNFPSADLAVSVLGEHHLRRILAILASQCLSNLGIK
jgi:hypothetical protein